MNKNKLIDLKVAIKGDGTEEYAALLFNYFYEYCVKCRLMVDDFIPELYYHIENDKVVYCPHLPEGYTEISLKHEEVVTDNTKVNTYLLKRVEELETELTELKLKLKENSDKHIVKFVREDFRYEKCKNRRIIKIGLRYYPQYKNWLGYWVNFVNEIPHYSGTTNVDRSFNDENEAYEWLINTKVKRFK